MGVKDYASHAGAVPRMLEGYWRDCSRGLSMLPHGRLGCWSEAIFLASSPEPNSPSTQRYFSGSTNA